MLTRKAATLNDLFGYEIPYWRTRDVDMALCGIRNEAKGTHPAFLVKAADDEPIVHIATHIATLTYDAS